MFQTIEDVINNSEVFDDACYNNNFQLLLCNNCPVQEACRKSSYASINPWPAELLAAYQTKLEEEASSEC